MTDRESKLFDAGERQGARGGSPPKGETTYATNGSGQRTDAGERQGAGGGSPPKGETTYATNGSGQRTDAGERQGAGGGSPPKGNRLHLGIFGRRNVGKSSLLNALTRQNSSIVSDVAGTTTDPVEKAMELLPLGPVLFIDTAGLDDLGELGTMRVERTRQVFDRTDIALLVVDSARKDGGWSEYEESFAAEFQRRKIPVIAVLNKVDVTAPSTELLVRLTERSLPFVEVSAGSNEAAAGSTASILRDALIRCVPDDFLAPPPIIADLISENELAILVTPIDKEAPKGRLILPEVQTLRDLLDHRRLAMVVQTEQLPEAIRRGRPKLVVTDSQAFGDVARLTPPEIPLTSFSILFARQKGNFAALLAGARAMGTLGPEARILVAEACSHHPIAEDIGTEKIPRWLKARLGERIEIGHVQGHDFPATDERLAAWDLVIHCGGCVWNRREMLQRIARCASAGVPMTNYGLAIAFLHGILDRATAMLDAAGQKRAEK